jgi:hypothetical protein
MDGQCPHLAPAFGCEPRVENDGISKPATIAGRCIVLRFPMADDVQSLQTTCKAMLQSLQRTPGKLHGRRTQRGPWTCKHWLVCGAHPHARPSIAEINSSYLNPMALPPNPAIQIPRASQRNPPLSVHFKMMLNCPVYAGAASSGRLPSAT